MIKLYLKTPRNISHPSAPTSHQLKRELTHSRSSGWPTTRAHFQHSGTGCSPRHTGNDELDNSDGDSGMLVGVDIQVIKCGSDGCEFVV